MTISKEMQELFTNEIDFVIERMKGTNSATEKMYFFSGTYACALRIINIEFDAELAFIHHVLQSAYQMIDARITRIQQGQDRPIGIPEKLFDRLEETLKEMSARIKKGEETYSVLQTIFNLAYSTTGNGYYLHLKGLLPV